MNNLDINLEILKLTLNEIKDLKDDLVFLGGSTISLFITEPLNVSIRETVDVDCVVEVAHRGDYEEISRRLRLLGFHESAQNKVICRFQKGSLILDVMPTDSKIFGFTNIWYKDGFRNSIKIKLENLQINVFDLPYLIATKIEAFKGRGKGNFLLSHDIEDIVTLFDGRAEIVKDLDRANENVHKYLIFEFRKMMSDKNFVASLEAHVSDRVNLKKRIEIVIERINSFILSK